MEVLLIIGGIWLLIWIGLQFYNDRIRQPPSRPSDHPRSFEPRPPDRKDVYRPQPPTTRRRPKIVFGPISGDPGGGAVSGLEGLHDAFTGAALNPALGLHQCMTCQVYYHSESVDVLRQENAGHCVACGGSTLIQRNTQEATARSGRDYNPDVVTLANFRSHFDRVVTFEGNVREVKVSKRGKDYAVMFEHASWTKGLKLVFFRGAVDAVGGVRFIKGLKGHQVRVRGLLLNHRIFGPEIIISERGMILDIR